MNRKRLQPYVDVFTEGHCTIEDITITGSNHLKFKVVKGDQRKFFIAPVSGSDHCGLQNFKHDVRRWLKTTGDSR
ncbi:hypothetical protein UFOVP55_24 [uncultured Caudovirales phage]|uniref:Uncharacterized protein n=1 Tax=uncultured Caudovirales phage TaxID=2100421 RepID=A0A6J5KQR5_9CAUD|nr:hypothetical protein UFOVP55_24 [uncultured Caudovirales phage]